MTRTASRMAGCSTLRVDWWRVSHRPGKGSHRRSTNLRALLLQFASSGVTSVNVAGVRPDQLRHFQALYDREGAALPRATLQIRLRPGYDAYDDLDLSVRDAIAELEGLGFVTGFGDQRLQIGAIKMSIDGGLSAPAYWSTEGYEDRPEYTGAIRIPAEAFYPVARRAHELGWQLGNSHHGRRRRRNGR